MMRISQPYVALFPVNLRNVRLAIHHMVHCFTKFRWTADDIAHNSPGELKTFIAKQDFIIVKISVVDYCSWPDSLLWLHRME